MTKKQYAKLWKKIRRYADSEVSRSWAGATCQAKEEFQAVEEENKKARKSLVEALKGLNRGTETSKPGSV